MSGGLRCAMLALACAMARPALAHAEDTHIGAGAFVGARFAAQVRIEWGLEAYLTRVVDESRACSTKSRAGLGGLVQVSWVAFELARPRIALASHGELELERHEALAGMELGASYRFARDGGFGIHSGALFEVLLVNAAFRYQWLRNDAWLGGGLRAVGTLGGGGVCAMPHPDFVATLDD